MNGLVWVESVFRYSSVSISEVLNLIGFRSVCRFLFEMPPFPSQPQILQAKGGKPVSRFSPFLPWSRRTPSVRRLIGVRARQ